MSEIDQDPTQQDPPVSDLMANLLRRVARRGRRELERASEVGRFQLELRQSRRDLDEFWVRMGKTAFHLVQAGEVDHPALERAQARIAELQERIAKLEQGEETD